MPHYLSMNGNETWIPIGSLSGCFWRAGDQASGAAANNSQVFSTSADGNSAPIISVYGQTPPTDTPHRRCSRHHHAKKRKTLAMYDGRRTAVSSRPVIHRTIITPSALIYTSYTLSKNGYITSTLPLLLSQSSLTALSIHSPNTLALWTAVSIHPVISSKLNSIPPAFCKTQSVGEEEDERCVSAMCSVEGRRRDSVCVGSRIGCGLTGRGRGRMQSVELSLCRERI